MFPQRKNIWLPLLKVLKEAGGSLKPAEAIKRVETYFPELTEDDKHYQTPRGRLRWEDHDVPWAKYDLLHQGLMVNEKYGQWQISDEGLAYLEEHWKEWTPSYSKKTSEEVIPEGEPGDNDSSLTESRNYWWVNQGQSYDEERDAGYVWAPSQDSHGRPHGHWQRVSQIQKNDILIHYSNGEIQAISIAKSRAEERDNPHKRNHNQWNQHGWAADIQYYDLPVPYPISRWSNSIAFNIFNGPFNKRGGIKQGYLWNFNEDAFQSLTSDGSFSWPSDIPLIHPTQEKTVPNNAMYENPVVRESGNSYGIKPFALLEIFQQLQAAGYQISLEEFLNVLLSLHTRPFVIFSGRSGTGKTSLTEIIASLFDWHYFRVAVSPAWTDPADLLGFVSPLSHERVSGALDELLLDEAEDVLLCLDEFNIAKVEHYFSDFISAMDNTQNNSFWTPLRNLDRQSMQQTTTLRLPSRLRIIATMNFDDSVQSITPRVLDRANVIEFDVINENGLIVERSLNWAVLRQSRFRWPWNGEILPSDEVVIKMIRKIWPSLRNSRGQFSHRVAQEIYRYVLLGQPFGTYFERNDEEQRNALMDHQIAQRILPKFHGTASNRDIMALMRLLTVIMDQSMNDSDPMDQRKIIDEARNRNIFPKTVEKIDQLVTTYSEDGYASFW